MGLPARCYDTFDGLYFQPKESFVRKYGGRIAGGMACAAIVSFIMHLPYIKLAILWLCQGVIFVFGRPAGYDKLPEIKKKAAQTVAKAKEIVHGQNAGKAAMVIPLAVPKAAAKLKEEARVVKQATQVVHGQVKIAEAGHDMAKAVKDAGTKAKEAAENAGSRVAKALHDRKEAKDQAQYDQLIVRARVVGLKVDEGWSVTRLDAEVNQAEDDAWRKRYNAQCPYCHRPVRIRQGLKFERFICPSCRSIYSVESARALGAPPRPRPSSWRLPL